MSDSVEIWCVGTLWIYGAAELAELLNL